MPHLSELFFLGLYAALGVFSAGESSRHHERYDNESAAFAAFGVGFITLVFHLVVRDRRKKRAGKELLVHDLHTVRDVSVGIATIFLGPLLGTLVANAQALSSLGGPASGFLMFGAVLGVLSYCIGSVTIGACLRVERSVFRGSALILASVAAIAVAAKVTSNISSSSSALEGLSVVRFPMLAQAGWWMYIGSAVVGVIGCGLIGVSLFVSDSLARKRWRGRVLVASIVEVTVLALAMVTSAVGSITESFSRASAGLSALGEFVGASCVWRVFFVLGAVGWLVNDLKGASVSRTTSSASN
jgi:hypothetical protein